MKLSNIFITLFALSMTLQSQEVKPPVGYPARTLTEGELALKKQILMTDIIPLEVYPKRGNFKLCFKCRTCKNRTFQRLYLRYHLARLKLNRKNNEK